MATYLSRVDGQVSANQSYIILTVFKYNIPNIGVDFWIMVITYQLHNIVLFKCLFWGFGENNCILAHL